MQKLPLSTVVLNRMHRSGAPSLSTERSLAAAESLAEDGTQTLAALRFKSLPRAPAGRPPEYGARRQAPSVLPCGGFRMENSRNFTPNDGSTAYTFVGEELNPSRWKRSLPGVSPLVPCSDGFAFQSSPAGTCRGTKAVEGEGAGSPAPEWHAGRDDATDNERLGGVLTCLPNA